MQSLIYYSHIQLIRTSAFRSVAKSKLVWIKMWKKHDIFHALFYNTQCINYTIKTYLSEEFDVLFCTCYAQIAFYSVHKY